MKKTTFIIVFILFSTLSIACTCIGKGKLKHAVKDADVMVVGRILSQKRLETKLDSIYSDLIITQVEYRILVTQHIKGRIVNDTIQVVTGIGNGDCGIKFKIGSTYIIYSYYSKSESGEIDTFLSTDICTRTKEFNKEEMKKIKRIVKRHGYS